MREKREEKDIKEEGEEEEKRKGRVLRVLRDFVNFRIEYTRRKKLESDWMQRYREKSVRGYRTKKRKSSARSNDLSRLVDLSLREAERGFQRRRRVCSIIERP